jgi:hypothetical protein
MVLEVRASVKLANTSGNKSKPTNDNIELPHVPLPRDSIVTTEVHQVRETQVEVHIVTDTEVEAPTSTTIATTNETGVFN